MKISTTLPDGSFAAVDTEDGSMIRLGTDEAERAETARMFVAGEPPFEAGGNTSLWFVEWGKYPLPRTRWQKFRLKAVCLGYRVRDSWEVLRGRADIY